MKDIGSGDVPKTGPWSPKPAERWRNDRKDSSDRYWQFCHF